MSRPILPVAFASALLLALAVTTPVQARVAQARIAKVTTGVATLDQVRVRLDWPAGATTGTLDVWAARVQAPAMDMTYRDLHWRCPLQRTERAGWRCTGQLRSGRGAPLQLAVEFDTATTQAEFSRGSARITLDRNAATPDLTRLDLTRVPVAWAQALLSKAWTDARFTAGSFDARLGVESAANRPLRISGPVVLRDLGLETADARIAGEHLGGRLEVDYRTTPALSLLTIDGDLRGGEFLVGNTYVALPASAISVRVDALQRDKGGWELPRIEWRDGTALNVEGSATFRKDASLRNLDMDVRSGDMTPLRQRYLSGWLGLFGLGEIDLHGAMDLRLQMRDGKLAVADATLHDVDIRDPAQRFVFDGLQGNLRYSLGAPVDSTLRWQAGKLYGLDFAAARLPFASRDGTLRLREDARVPLLGGGITFRDLVIRPPQGAAGADIRFGLVVDDIDVGQLSKALGLPAFQGRLSGSIPNARYANERVDFDGGLSMQLFDGRVEVSSLALERPFGTAPSLSADIVLDDLDLLRLTGVLGFGSVSGRLDGHILGLRLVDWTAVAFNARFNTDAKRGVKQRISQRAVQNISSVGDASFVTSLQGQLIGIFDDFGYRRIGIACRLANEVCAMSGLQDSDDSQASNSFTIVQGAGIPRLDVVGFNRQVDWPTLVERLSAVASGEVKPVVQ